MLGEFSQFCAIGIGSCMPLALDAIGVETVAIGVETGIPMPNEVGVEIGVGIGYWRSNFYYRH